MANTLFLKEEKRKTYSGVGVKQIDFVLARKNMGCKVIPWELQQA